jgi:hypothetical protein
MKAKPRLRKTSGAFCRPIAKSLSKPGTWRSHCTIAWLWSVVPSESATPSIIGARINTAR